MDETLTFEEGKPCPIKIQGNGGGLSFSSAGAMLLIGAFPNPSAKQIQTWSQKWRAKLVQESDFPSIPVFAVGNDEGWIIEAPCNPVDQERESPGFCEALYALDDYKMLAALVDSETGIIRKIQTVELDEMFIERLVLSWNPYRRPSDEYTKSFNSQEFAKRVESIFRSRTSQQLWQNSW